MAFPANGVLDNFNRADGDAGANWSKIWSGDYMFTVASNQIKCPWSANWANAGWNVATFGADCEAYVTIATVSGANSISVYARMSALNTAGGPNGYRVSLTALNTLSIQRLDSGSPTTLGATISQTISNGDSLGIECTGSTIKAYYKASGGSWTEIGSRTDATYGAAGYIGLECYNDVIRFDDFGGGTIAGAPARVSYSTFYFDSTAVPVLAPSYSADWEHNTQAVRRRLNLDKRASAMTSKQTTVDASDHLVNQDNLFFQYICDQPLDAQTISASQAIKLQMRAAEDNAGNNLYLTAKCFLIDRAGSAVAGGEIFAITRDNQEVATSLTNRQFTVTAPAADVTVPDGSYLVIEIGLGGTPANTTGTQDHDGTLRVGDAAASDLAEDNTTTADNNPWLKIPNGLYFAPAPAPVAKPTFTWRRR